MSSECSLCPESTVYVPRVQFMTTEYDIFPQIVVNLLILLCISQEHSIPPNALYAPEYSLYLEHSLVPQRTVYFPRVQFMSTVYSLCPQSTVFQFQEYSFSVPRVQFMSAEYSLCPQSTVSVPREQFMSLEHG